MPDDALLFEDAFSGGISGCRGTCQCGRSYFDNYNSGIDWDEGEIEGLLERSRKEPDRVIPSDGSVSFIEVDGVAFVWGCKCQGWIKYQKFLVRHAPQIAAFLRARQAALTKEAAALQF